MSGVYRFDEYIASASKALEEGNTETAMEWVDRAISLSKHLDEETLAGVYHLKARILIAEEEYSEAEELLRKSLEMSGRNQEGMVLLGEVTLLDGRYEDAATAFESALKLGPEEVHPRSLLIFCYGQTGNHDRARECFEKCVALDAELADSYYHMGICLFNEGKGEASEFFEKALAKNPVLSGPHYYLGRMRIAEGDFAGAEKELQSELELNPANSLAELELMRSYLLAIPWQEALDLFDRHFPAEVFCDIPALKGCRFHFNYELLDEKFRSFIHAVKANLPQTNENVFRVAKLYRVKSLLGEAAEHLKKIMEDNRNFRPAYRELAELYRIQDELSRACEVLEETARIFGDAEAYRELGRTLLSSGRYSEAQEAVRKAAALAPDDAEAHYLLGATLSYAAGRTADRERLMEEAAKSIRKALEINPQYEPARVFLMHMALEGGRYDECLTAANQFLKENPQDRMALLYSGRCLHATGNLNLAMERLKNLLELHPDDQTARGALAEVHRDLGKPKEAAEELEQAVALPGRRPPLDLLFRLGEIYLTDLNEPAKARDCLFRFLRAAPPGHPNFDRAVELLGRPSLE